MANERICSAPLEVPSYSNVTIGGVPLPGIAPADGEWVVFLPDNPTLGTVLDLCGLSKWNPFGPNTIATDPHLEIWRHRDPSAR